MKKLLSLVLILSVVLLSGCGGGTNLQKTSAGDIPEWYLNQPQDPNYIFAAVTQTSTDMQMAVDKATTSGRAELARQLELKLNNLQKKFAEEVGTNENATILNQFTEATKVVVSQTLNGSTVKEKKLNKDGNTWRAYVLVQYPMGSANKVLMDQIKKNDELYTRFRSSQTFQEAEKDWEKLDKEKSQTK